MQIQDLLNEGAALASKVDLSKVLAIVSSAVTALPAIKTLETSAVPYLEALEKVLAGGTPTDAEFAALDSRLDTGSATLHDAAAETDPNAV